MKVTAFTRAALAVRREARLLEAAGYRRHETDWEIHRGSRIGDRIIDARISADGLYIWTKLSNSPSTPNAPQAAVRGQDGA